MIFIQIDSQIEEKSSTRQLKQLISLFTTLTVFSPPFDTQARFTEITQKKRRSKTEKNILVQKETLEIAT